MMKCHWGGALWASRRKSSPLIIAPAPPLPLHPLLSSPPSPILEKEDPFGQGLIFSLWGFCCPFSLLLFLCSSPAPVSSQEESVSVLSEYTLTASTKSMVALNPSSLLSNFTSLYPPPREPFPSTKVMDVLTTKSMCLPLMSGSTHCWLVLSLSSSFPGIPSVLPQEWVFLGWFFPLHPLLLWGSSVYRAQTHLGGWFMSRSRDSYKFVIQPFANLCV